jgi:nucleoside phosphorylase
LAPTREDPSALLVAAPMALEARLVSAPGLRVRRTGVGRRRAHAAGVAIHRDGPPALLVVIGFAGGLEPGARAGEVVVAGELCGRAGERVRCPAADLLGRVLAARGIGARGGAVASVVRPVLGSGRSELRGQTGAVAADMESLWLVEAAAAPAFGVVRVIVDAPRSGAWAAWASPARFLAACRALRSVAGALGEWALAEPSYRVADALGFASSQRAERERAPRPDVG